MVSKRIASFAPPANSTDIPEVQYEQCMSAPFSCALLFFCHPQIQSHNIQGGVVSKHILFEVFQSTQKVFYDSGRQYKFFRFRFSSAVALVLLLLLAAVVVLVLLLLLCHCSVGTTCPVTAHGTHCRHNMAHTMDRHITMWEVFENFAENEE